ncbi:MAG: Cys-tRNA(Pro) deacylase [Ferrimonas sp.]
MTPAITQAKRAKVAFTVHQYQHGAGHPSFGQEAAEALQQPPERIFKTLLCVDEHERLVVAVVPVAGQLDLRALAKTIGCKRCVMAAPALAEKVTGYVVGGISPLGQKKRLPCVLDSSAKQWPTVFISAGRRGLEIELSPPDLVQLTQAKVALIGRIGD